MHAGWQSPVFSATHDIRMKLHAQFPSKRVVNFLSDTHQPGQIPQTVMMNTGSTKQNRPWYFFRPGP